MAFFLVKNLVKVNARWIMMLPRRNKDEQAPRPYVEFKILKNASCVTAHKRPKRHKVNVTDIIHLQPQNKVKQKHTPNECLKMDVEIEERILPSGEVLVEW